MPPTNISFVAATVISSLPYDFTQTDINDAGVNYTVYYKITAPLLSRVLGGWGFSGNIGSGYRPTIRPYIGPAGTPTQILGIGAQNKPIQFPVNESSEYFLEFTKNLDNAGPNSLRVRVEVAPLLTINRGNIAVNDDTTGFPLAVISELADHTIRNFVKDMPAGEAGDILSDNIACLEDAVNVRVKLINTTTFAITFTSANLGGTIRVRRSAANNKFFVGHYTGGVVTIRTLTSAGVLSVGFTLTPVTSIESLCADAAEAILYYAGFGINSPIKRWDLPGAGALSDLATVGANVRVPDILVLSDGTIIALHWNSVSQDVTVIRYSTAGAVLNTYSFGVQTGTTKPRLAWALDNPTSFWLWTHTATASIFRNTRCSDGVVLTTRTQQEYEGGALNATETATPLSRFGNSFSCPFFILTANAGPSGIYKIVTDRRYDNDGINNVAIPAPTFKTALMP